MSQVFKKQKHTKQTLDKSIIHSNTRTYAYIVCLTYVFFATVFCRVLHIYLFDQNTIAVKNKDPYSHTLTDFLSTEARQLFVRTMTLKYIV